MEGAQKMTEVGFLWLIPFFPFLGAAINGLCGKVLQDRFGKKVNHTIAIGAMALSAAVALYAFFGRLLPLEGSERYLHDPVWQMISLGSFKVDFALAVDPLAGMMILIITLIGTGIHVYSAGYMANEPAYWRFFCYLNLFVFSMLLLVLGDSFLLMFFGWEGVGLCSYLLIGFWYKDFDKATAGMKAFVVNRVGDWGFVCGLGFLFWGLGGAWDELRQYHAAMPGAGGTHATLVFREIAAQLSVPQMQDALLAKTLFGVPVVFLACLGFFVGATGKSAQIPLYVWLPDAMAGPTPVSALIHAATMVTAGVYMVARLNFVFALSPGALTVVATIGAFTALFAATMGLFQYDIKKVLAYSTVSQLGFMFLGVGTGAWWAGAFHLLTHACFKACLFLGSGSVIHGMHYLEHGHGHGDDGHGNGHGHDAPHEHDADHEHQEGHHDDVPYWKKTLAKKPDLHLAPNPQDPQDMRNMGGLRALMPKTHWTYLIACWAIAGFPWAAGFYSKDEILWKAFSTENLIHPGYGKLLWFVGVLAATCTSFYMFRSYYMTFHFRAPSEEMKHHVHESPGSMTYVLIALAAASLVAGIVLGLPYAWTHRPPMLEHFLEPVFAPSANRVRFGHGSVALELGLMATSVGVATIGWWLARTFYRDATVGAARLDALRDRYLAVHRVLFNKYYVDELYQKTAVRGFMAFARLCANLDRYFVDGLVNLTGKITVAVSWVNGAIDKYFVDGAVNALATGIIAGGRRMQRLQTGRINNYAAVVALGAVALIVIAFFGGQ